MIIVKIIFSFLYDSSLGNDDCELSSIQFDRYKIKSETFQSISQIFTL